LLHRSTTAGAGPNGRRAGARETRGDDVPTTGSLFQVPTTVIDFQRRMLEFQRSAFSNAFELAARFQDRRRDVLERWIDRVPNLPAESKELFEAWNEAADRGRESFRATIDKSFDLIDGYYERLASERRPGANTPSV
jgi:hypothetical protein